ncbi:LADA_0G15214g1_1 [Lachancea dasiensis]|uniref:LADA_0G15214g1_1 n=1 Tax=Lachancea dasiensis TaxID=1072105 RepID=A0A1G4JW97_9SACH|nr:LADA_0G15214g1_1 [Lachancea dasiensis]
MTYTFPATPSKQSRHESENKELASCLKGSGNPDSYQHKHSTSQVRFSLPLEPDEQSSTYGSEEETSGRETSQLPCTRASPTRVVFPKSSDGDSSQHFVDFQNRVMIDVPEHIWQFHNDRGRDSECVTSPTKGHRRQPSLQSMIADTIQNYQPSPSRSKATGVGNERPRLKATELYLRSDSPLNRYQVAVPLEAALPPYLSPENKSKRRSSFIYDGEGYSLFSAQDAYSGSLSDGHDSIQHSLADRSTSHYSDSSIPSAMHEYSFDAAGDVDKMLGIDGDANVSLKKQARNLLDTTHKHSREKTTYSRSPPTTALSTPTKSTSRADLQPTHLEAPREANQAGNYDTLTSPSKTIFIPDIESITASPIKNTVSRFLAKMDEVCENKKSTTNFNESNDEINANFRFPSPKNSTDQSSQSAGNDDFLHISEAAADNSFERRRKLLQRQSSEGVGLRKHTHSRTRSIHNSRDLFDIAKGQQVENTGETEEIQIPARSPKRAEARSLSVIGSRSGKIMTTSSPIIGSHNESKIIEQGPAGESIARPTSGSMNTPSKENKTDVKMKSNLSFSTAHPTKDEPDQHKTQHTSSFLNSPNEVLATNFFATTNDELDFQESSGFESKDSTNNDTFDGEINNEKSIEILGESKIANMKPLSTYHSFMNPLIPATEGGLEALSTIPFKAMRSLAPSREFSNNSSQSSISSRDSLPSHPSTATAYSQQSRPTSNQLFSLVKKNPNIPFSTANRPSHLPSPEVEPSALKSLSPRITQEYIGGKLVDVVLLDDSEDESSQATKERPKSVHEEAIQHYREILELCDKTAERAKGVILDLVNAQKQPAAFNQHGLPTRTISPCLEDTKTAFSPGPKLPKHARPNHSAGSLSGSRYISNLERIRVPGKNS